jgi:methylmalonyl-CoA mutase
VRPRIFLANLGTAADYTARATFARSFFEAGGIEAVDSDGSSPEQLAAGFQASGAAIACLCSSDKVYAELAADAARALQVAGSKHIYLAGRVSDLEATLNTAGVDAFIFAGCDALSVLEDAYRRMERP